MCVLFLEWRIQLSSMFTLAHPFQDSQDLFWNADAQANHSSGQRIPPHRLLQYAVSHTHTMQWPSTGYCSTYYLFLFLAPSFEFPLIFDCYYLSFFFFWLCMLDSLVVVGIVGWACWPAGNTLASTQKCRVRRTKTKVAKR